MSRRRVVVTGMGALTPLGLTVESFWEGMMASTSGCAPITYFDTETYDTKFACELKGYEATDYVDRKRARRLDQFSQYAIGAANQAVADSGIGDDPSVNKDRVGVAFGSGIGGLQYFHKQVDVLINHGNKKLSPFFIPMIIADIAAGLISIDHGFRGPNYCAVSACATGNNNIGDSVMLIRQGYADAMLTGGAEGPICELGIGGFNAMKALSTRNDDPQGASRPFDATRDGFVLGEGAGALVLEELGHAQKRGAKIYAEIVGLGFSGDAFHMTAPDPEGSGAALAMKMMIDDAGLAPNEVDYLNMHGTSTPLGDKAETNAIKKVFGESAYTMNLSSTKSMTGHLLGAAGAVEAIASVLAIVNNKVPPTINFKEADPDCDLNYTFNTPQERTVDVAASNSFGFGGHNTSLIFKRFAE